MTFRCRFALQVQRIVHCQKPVKNEGFVAVSKMAGVGHLKRIWKAACCVASLVQETHELELVGGHTADFLKMFAF